MKRYYSNLIILVTVLVIACHSLKGRISSNIYNEQNKVGKIYANSAKWTREDLLSKYSDNILSSDTLFLIERVAEPTLEVWSNIWTSKRDFVYEYERDSEISRDTVLNYKTWQNRYRNNVEQFDIATLDKYEILGGYRTFITQVIRGKEVKTFFFHDSYSSYDQSGFSKP